MMPMISYRASLIMKNKKCRQQRVHRVSFLTRHDDEGEPDLTC